VPAYGPQNDVTLKMPAFEWVHVQLHQQKGMISLSPPTICNSAAPVAACAARKSRSMPPSRRKGPSTWSISAGWSAISASRRGPALRPKPASNRTLVIRRRQVEAYPNLMSDAMCKLRQDRIEF
ncbi:hypothetical protein ECO9574_20656, partial [Escherichia coli O111:H8 str. CVM9574]